MKKILSILALLIMAILLASCGGNKEGSKAKESGEPAKVETAESANPAKVTLPVKQTKVEKKDNVSNNMS